MKHRNPKTPYARIGRALAKGVFLFSLCLTVSGCALTDQQRASLASGMGGVSQGFKASAPDYSSRVQPVYIQPPQTHNCYSANQGGGYSYVTCN